MSDSTSSPQDVSTQHGYDRWSQIYDVEDNPLIKLEMRHFYPRLHSVAGCDVLDVGCGTGRLAATIAAAGGHVTGMDFSTGMLNKARSKPELEGVDFVEHDIESPWPFAANSFDVIVCGLVMDHIRDVTGLFRQMRRVARANGRVIVSVMHPAMTLRDVRARFTDPDTGIVTRPEMQFHQVSDYVMGVVRAGLTLVEVAEYRVDEELMACSQRARRYAGWPLLLIVEAVATAEGSVGE